MIDFPCHCGHRFSVPADMAGASIQCPKCHLLNDVPTLGDLPGILPDGTYAMDAPTPRDPEKLAGMLRAFDRSKYEEDGTEKDLRPSLEDVLRAGAPPAPPGSTPITKGPKYDPETGELLRPVEVAPAAAVVGGGGAGGGGASGARARPVIPYAEPKTHARVPPMRVFLELFSPANAMVMAFIFAFHLLLQVMVIIVSVLFPIVVIFVLIVAILAHYGCVIDDVGPDDRDELPRPLRNLSFIDDIWTPFWNFIGAWILCYGPSSFAAVRLGTDNRPGLFAVASLWMLGSILFPAVWLTLQTSGAALTNLRPDRVLGLIRATGPGRYALLVLFWIVAMNVYAAGVYGLDFAATVGLLIWKGRVSKFYWAAAILLLMLGIYLMHAFCWQLGLLYRAKHHAFPWALQRHIRLEKREHVAINEAARATINTKRQAIRRGGRF